MKLALSSGRRPREIAEEFEISVDSVQRWIRQAQMVPDVFSRRVVGWAMGARQTAALARSALDVALKPCAAKGVIFHSDHGSQLTALVFTSRCEQAGALQSTGTVGSC